MIEPIHARVSSPVDGKASGPPLLFIHGDFSNGTMSWSRQWSGLKDERFLIVIDRRGHGDSPKEPSPYTIHQDAMDIISTIQRLSPDGVSLVGHSYGAIVALETACLTPELVSSLYLIEPPYLSLLPEDPDVRQLAEQTHRLRAQASHLTSHELATTFFDNVIGKEAVHQLQTKPVWSAIVDEAQRFTRSQFVGEYPPERLNDFPQKHSVTLFFGGRSHPALQRLTQTLHQRLPSSRLCFFPDAGHDVQRMGEPFNAELS